MLAKTFGMQREGQCVRIEARFNVPVLTKRDAAQINMTQFFNFNFPPWMTPPTPPVQTTSGSCYLNQLP